MKDVVKSYKCCCNYRNQFSKPDQLVPVEILVELNLAFGKAWLLLQYCHDLGEQRR